MNRIRLVQETRRNLAKRRIKHLENLDKLFAVINTNARSLYPKLNSLNDCMEETGAYLSVVTETWLRSGDELDKRKEHLGFGITGEVRAE